jgi:hypothetical protein
MPDHRIYRMAFAKVHAALVAKVERKGRTGAEVDCVIRWLTGYDDEGIAAALADGTNVETFFARAPRLNPARAAVTGKVCGVQVEEVAEEPMRLIRILDKQVDELARGWAIERVLRE